jgi:hypothetical protein
MSKLTPAEQITAQALEFIRNGAVPPCPAWLQVLFAEIDRRNPDFAAETRALLRSTIEKTTN